MSLTELPPNLPRPIDDGACDHLAGMALPSLALLGTDGSTIDLAALPGRVVVFCYPMTGVSGKPQPEGWDMIPGARGCTAQSCAFRDLHGDLAALGAGVFGLSTQDTAYQREMAERLHLPFLVLSDEKLEFTQALNLPVFQVEGQTLIKRLTLILRDGAIEHVLYPVFPPDKSAAQVIGWLKDAPALEAGSKLGVRSSTNIGAARDEEG